MSENKQQFQASVFWFVTKHYGGNVWLILIAYVTEESKGNMGFEKWLKIISVVVLYDSLGVRTQDAVLYDDFAVSGFPYTSWDM